MDCDTPYLQNEFVDRRFFFYVFILTLSFSTCSQSFIKKICTWELLGANVFKERVVVNFGDYFCCIHIFSAKLLICSQTFVNLKYIQKLFDVRLIFTPMYGGFTDCTKHASAAALSHRQQTLY